MKVIVNIVGVFLFNYMMMNVFSILLSFILLVSHISLTIGTHFCGGEAVETKIILGETHLGCGMMDMEDPLGDSENACNNRVSFDKIPCCENEYHTVQVSYEFLKDAAQKTFNAEFAIVFIYTQLNIDLYTKSRHQFFTENITPPFEKDIQVLFQTFLI